jgi:RNA polymerase sigma-70 factor (ECF subfamily)
MQQELTKLTDKQLVQAYANGNNAAFDTLLNRHQKAVFNYILHIVKDQDLANDIFQETFVKAITVIRQGRYEDNGKFGGWINRVAHNLIIDHFRRNKAENTVSNEADGSDLFNDKDLCEDSIEDVLVQTQLTKDLRRLVRELPASQREVIMMRIYRDMSFKEIAEETGVSINTALGRMRYALRNMRRLVDETRVLEIA